MVKQRPLTMRPFAVVFGLLVAMGALCGLSSVEELPRRKSDDRTEAIDEPLRKMKFSASLRRDNFETMGLDPSTADQAAEASKRLLVNKARYEKMLEEQAADVGIAFCPEPSQLPVVYGAMRFLVIEEGKVRSVVDGYNQLLRFTDQPWYSTNNSVRPVYDALESRKDRRLDATVMGIAAILASREGEAANREGPWSNNAFLGGTFDTVTSANPSVRLKTIEYMALVHVLAEIANKPDGICDSELL